MFKKTFLLMMSLILVATIFSSCTNSNPQSENIELLTPRGQYVHKLFDDWSIECNGSIKYSLKHDDKNIVSGTFYKYSYSNNRYIAVHIFSVDENTDENELSRDNSIKINMTSYRINSDQFLLYDTGEMKEYYYGSYDEFFATANNLNISFDNWFYDGNKSQKLEITDNCYIEYSEKSKNELLFVNSSPIFEGVIKEYAVVDDETVLIQFDVVDFDYGPEFTNTNAGLLMDKFSSNKKHHSSGLMFFDVLYSSYIALNTNTGEYKQFKTKKDISPSVNKKIDWISR